MILTFEHSETGELIQIETLNEIIEGEVNMATIYGTNEVLIIKQCEITNNLFFKYNENFYWHDYKF